LTEGVHYSTKQSISDWHIGHTTSTANLVAFFNIGVRTEKHSAHRIFLKVKGEAHNTIGEFEELAGHSPGQTVNGGYAVADFDNGTNVYRGDWLSKSFDLLFDNRRDFLSAYTHPNTLRKPTWTNT
jgi:hypothetical protein